MSTIQTWSRVMLALIMMSGGAFGQTASDPSEGLRAELTGTAGVTAIKWWGMTGRTYFLQSSETLLPGSWLYMPVVEVGSGAVRSWNLQTNAERMFVRLVYTDQDNGGNASTADFDGDGISNAAEVAVGGPGTDPLLADSDWDGYNDGVELAAGTSPTNGQTNPGTAPPASGDLNPDSRYRHGLRLDIAAKFMMAQDFTSTYPSDQPYNCYAFANHTAGSSQSIFPYQSSTTSTLLEDCQEAFDQAGFHSPSKSLFELNGLIDLRGTRSDTLSTGTGLNEGKSSEKYFRERWEMQVQAQASPAAAPWVRRSLALLLLRNYSTTDVETAGWVMLSKHNVRASPSAVKHCKIAGSKVVISPWLDPDQPDLDSSSSKDYRYINRSIKLLDAEIEPADGMIGVVGDMVRSKSDTSHVRHFVTPKLTTEIPAPNVELKCGVSVADFDKYFEWEGDGQKGSPSNTYKVSRATTGDKAKKVKIKNKQTDTVVAEMHVWVVWCDAPTITNASATYGDWYQGIMGKVGKQYYCTSNRKFKYVIQPAEIITADDRPDLEGSPRKDPPGYSKPYLARSDDPPDTAGYKWDVSRQMKVTIRNPNGISESNLRSTFTGSLFDGQPLAVKVHDFPSNPAEGNDDPADGTEDSNPYEANSSQNLGHAKGEMTALDAPSFPEANAWTTPGGSYDLEANFREFCRLEITDGVRSTGALWFRISDYTPWHHYLNSIRGATEWEDTSSMHGPNHPIP